MTYSPLAIMKQSYKPRIVINCNIMFLANIYYKCLFVRQLFEILINVPVEYFIEIIMFVTLE